MRTRHEVIAIDTEAQTVTVRDLDAAPGSDTETTEPYDQLVIATGATPSRPELPGLDAAGVYGVQTLEDGIVLRRVVDEESPKRAVVVGAGYIGIEMAEAMLHRGIEVTLLCAEPTPMSTLDPDMGTLIADAMRGLGIDLHLGEHAHSFTVEDGRATAAVTDSGTYPADLVVLGIGAHPNVTLAREAAIEIGPSGGIATDDHQRTSAPHVFAAGDCVETRHLVTGAPVAIALGTHANKQGRVVGINATGGDATFPGVIGTAVTKICAYEVARTGLSEGEAKDAGLDAFGTVIDATSRAQYYPKTTTLRVKLVTENRHRAIARRADRRPGRCGEARRRAGCVHLELDDRRGHHLGRPRLRAAVLTRVGPGPGRRESRYRHPLGRYPGGRRGLRSDRRPPEISYR